MRVEGVRVDTEGSTKTLRARVRSDAPAHDDFPLAVSWSGADPDRNLVPGDALLAFLLVPAMALGEALDLGNLDVSSRLLDATERIRDIYCAWSEGLTRTEIVTTPRPRAELETGGDALFFSGGVDSWYSLLIAEAAGTPPSHLLFLVGFDMEERHVHRVDKATQMAEDTARRRGATLVLSRSNLRSFTDPLVGWSLYHGGYLAGVALGLGNELSMCHISASNSPDSKRAWGSHPDLDVLWSTEGLQMAHTGFDENRFEKIKTIAQSEEALDTLRVCWRPVDEYNCGRCDKCALAMAALYLIGKLDRASTFPNELDLRAVAKIHAHRRGERRTTLNAMIPVAHEQGERELARALEKAKRHRFLKPHMYVAAASRRVREHDPARARLKQGPPFPPEDD